MSAFPAFGSSNRTASGTPFYVTNEGVTGPGGLSAYSMGSDGTITAAGTFNTGGGPSGIAISPNGSYLYVTNFSGSPGVSAYTIGSGGALTAITTGTFAAGSNPNGIAISPNGNYLYTTNSGSGSGGSDSISGYSIGSGGSLSPITLSAAGFIAGVEPWGIAISPNGNYLYVTNVSSTGASGLSPYTINPDGTLAAITTGTFATGSGPKGIAISPNGNYLYVTNDGGSISAYTITSGSGALASNGTFTTVTNPQGGIAISPNGNYLYVTNVSSSGTNGLSAYAINSGGSLSLSSSGYTTGATPFGIAISPDGNYLYVTNIGSATGASGISAFRINSDGTLSPITLTTSGSTTGKYPAGIAIMP